MIPQRGKERERKGKRERGKEYTVGHPRDRDFMSVIAGWEKKVLVAYNYIINGIYDVHS